MDQLEDTQLTVKQAVAFTGLHCTTIRKAIRDGFLKANKEGNVIKVYQYDLEKWMEERNDDRYKISTVDREIKDLQYLCDRINDCSVCRHIEKCSWVVESYSNCNNGKRLITAKLKEHYLNHNIPPMTMTIFMMELWGDELDGYLDSIERGEGERFISLSHVYNYPGSHVRQYRGRNTQSLKCIEALGGLRFH